MNFAVLRKSFNDTSWLLLLMLASLLIFETVLVRALGDIQANLGPDILKLPMVSRILKLLVGGDLLENLTATGIVTIGFVHPFLLAITWSLLIAICTRFTVGELERGTADLLLTLPLTRSSVYVSTTLLWVLYGIPMSAFPLLGMAIGTYFFPLWEPVDLRRLALLLPNLYAMYLAVGGLAMMVGSLSSRRPVAVGVILGVLLLSIFINFLEQFWGAAKYFAFLGILYYYKPLVIARTGELLSTNLIALMAIGGVSWIIGWWRFTRRDVPAA